MHINVNLLSETDYGSCISSIYIIAIRPKHQQKGVLDFRSICIVNNQTCKISR